MESDLTVLGIAECPAVDAQPHLRHGREGVSGVKRDGEGERMKQESWTSSLSSKSWSWTAAAFASYLASVMRIVPDRGPLPASVEHAAADPRS